MSMEHYISILMVGAYQLLPVRVIFISLIAVPVSLQWGWWSLETI